MRVYGGSYLLQLFDVPAHAVGFFLGRTVSSLYLAFVPARLKECRESLAFLYLRAFWRPLADRACFDPMVAVRSPAMEWRTGADLRNGMIRPFA